jgi:hypothetical protein
MSPDRGGWLARFLNHRRVMPVDAPASAPAASRSDRAMDAFGHALMVLRPRDQRRLWQSPLARRLLLDYFPGLPEVAVPAEVSAWAARESLRQSAGAEPHPLTIARGPRRLHFMLHLDAQTPDQWLLVLRDEADDARLATLLVAFAPIDVRSAELLLWLADGSPATETAAALGLDAAAWSEAVLRICGHLGVEQPGEAARLAREALSPERADR